ncbi:MAG: hypothetical protein Q6373_009750, partial [Candidatus Sigynarchaeota archaeon]
MSRDAPVVLLFFHAVFYRPGAYRCARHMPEPVNVGFIGGGPRAESIFNTLIMNKRFEDQVVPVAMMDTSEAVVNNWR